MRRASRYHTINAAENTTSRGAQRLTIIGKFVEKIDLKTELKYLYGPSAKEVVQVDVPTLSFLMIDGEGDPNTSKAYTQAVEALFSVSYTAKFMVKRGAQQIDYAVMPLEGL